nr:unnamed protein product [Digitaria exilis]
MHPFCCAPLVPVSPAASAASSAAASSAEAGDPAMMPPPQPPPLPPPPPRSNSTPGGERRARAAGTSGGGGGGGSSPPEGVKLNEIVGGGISGILYKWVNYGRGWRPRWFALHDGVLSYYKIHGPDRILLSRETERGAKVIGEDSLRRLNRPSTSSTSHSNGHHQPRNPIGEIHLKVSTVRESRSDDRRFSIFSGTKTLHLRAETREDRAAWLEALRATKDMFPRMSSSEMVGPGDTAAAVAVSTERLRQRLQQEGVSEAAIADSERIVRAEFEALHKQLVLSKQKYALLVDTLRQLETEKVDLENTLVDESQRQSKEYGSASKSRHEKYSEGSASESDDYNEPQDPAEETDDDENIYFDTRDFLSSSSFKSSGSDFQRSEAGSDDEDDYPMDGIDPSMKSVGISYPYVRRRKKLPDPVEKEKGGNSLMRILSVAAFAVSGYASTDGRSCNREYSCKLKFKEQSIIDRNPHQARKMQESGWKPRWFAKDKATDTYRYTGGYWESREKGSWEGCPDIFGQGWTASLLFIATTAAGPPSCRVNRRHRASPLGIVPRQASKCSGQAQQQPPAARHASRCPSPSVGSA